MFCPETPFFATSFTTHSAKRAMRETEVSCCMYRNKSNIEMARLCRHKREAEVQLKPVPNPVLEGGECSAPRLDRFVPGNYTVHLVQEAAWASGSI